MITLSKESYSNIEASLERFYNSPQCPWSRVWNNGIRMGYPAVIERFDLECIEMSGQKVRIKLVCKENNDYVPFDEVFDRFMEG